jgi:hypothetical protein
LKAITWGTTPSLNRNRLGFNLNAQ